ncbi:hypothetical protein KAI92_03855 [Candidatus Parcubacteria bacterium]|nr:hypothetical protein [Candidatus Parcubacteria bacterium]
MSKQLTKNLIILFLGLFIVFVPCTVSALEFIPSVPLPDAPSGTVGSDGLALYFKAIYRYAMGMVGILATVVMMYGGIRWITAGGSPEAISDAKAWITAALTGVLLMLGTYTILYLVNSDLVNFRPVVLEDVEDTSMSNKPIDEGTPTGCCLKTPWGSNYDGHKTYLYCSNDKTFGQCTLPSKWFGEKKCTKVPDANTRYYCK